MPSFFKQILVLTLCLTPLFADQEISQLLAVSNAFRKVATKVKPNVVTIKTKYRFKVPKSHPFFEFVDPRMKPSIQTGEGTGVIYAKEGYIVTNYHVIKDAHEVRVVLHDNRDFLASKVGEDPKTDLVVLKIEADKLKPASWGNSDEVRVGDWAIAIGDAMGFQQTVTVGIISAKGRSGLRNESGVYEDFIQTDAAINRGNSGGPLCNIHGKVVGINAMIASVSGGSQGLGFAIPINLVRSVVDQLIDGGKVKRGFLGVSIEDLDLQLARHFNYDKAEGVLVQDVKDPSPAKKAGIREGDIIVMLNKRTVRNSRELRSRIAHHKPGSVVNLSLVREGKPREAKVEIGSLDGDEVDEDRPYGLSVRKATKSELRDYGCRTGLMVVSVKEGSAAYQSNIEGEQIIVSVDRQSVSSPEEFFDKIDNSMREKDGEALVYVKKSQENGFFVILSNKPH